MSSTVSAHPKKILTSGSLGSWGLLGFDESFGLSKARERELQKGFGFHRDVAKGVGATEVI